MSPRLWRPTKPTVFAILMVAAALAALLPARWTSCADGLMQPISPITWLISGGARRAGAAAENLAARDPTRGDFQRLQDENERLTRQVGQQSILIAEMERMIADVTGLQDQLVDLQARIIFAAVLGADPSPDREVLLISKGARHGVEVGDWVAAGMPPTQHPAGATGRELLLQQWLAGIIVEVQPHVSRVQLTTDPEFGTQLAWAAQPLTDDTWKVAERQCGLVGVGAGHMRIDRATTDYVATGHTIVLIPLAHPQPVALVAGRIVGSEPLDTGVHYDLQVEPWGDARALTHVYVISVSD
jgi:cell shape-determining protein MreC